MRVKILGRTIRRLMAAADLKRRNLARTPSGNPPPHVGGCGASIIFSFLLALSLLLCGCATSQRNPPTGRAFSFQTDTFAFANELVWEYYFDENGKWTNRPREPEPDYTHHCFVVARSARQFFEHARFDSNQPVADQETYRRLIRRVISRSAHHITKDSDRIVIPGYTDLHAFSAAQERLLKSECGGAWHSYFQHGHWRMLAPFSRRHQKKMAAQLVAAIQTGHPPIAHLVRFPQLSINHAVLLFAAEESDNAIRFTAYDPNKPKTPVTLTFDRATRTFQYPANDYFSGGAVDVYEAYSDWLH